jgi:hypothetical protein
MDLFGSKAEGDATADLSGVDSVFAIDVKAKNLEFAKLEESIGARRVIVGRGDLKASLKTKVRKGSPPLSGLAGTVSLRGDKLTITTLDLDKALSSYEASQQFSLVDLGAFFLISPLSVVALKGYDYGKAFSRAKGGQGQITHFISHWKIEGGLAEAIDCALATPHHRIALKGSLDLVTGRFDAGAMVAILDDQACAKRSQSIAGPLGSPKVGATNLATSFGGPIIDLFSKAKRFLKGGKCEVFYRGAVQQPSG